MSDKDKTTWHSEKTGIKITIDRHFCKGCNLCVLFCPVEGVLEMIDAPDKWEGAEAVVKNIEACTGCMLCEVQCPDFAIAVYSSKKEKAKERVNI
jgi:2-oxoglutarate ferredoxin oxidoreductase subunit delta